MDYPYHTEKTESDRVPVAEFLDRFVDVAKFLRFCESCENYNVGWGCPPYDFDPLDLWRRYSEVKAVGVRIVFDESVVGAKLDHEAWTELYDTVMRREKGKLYRELKEEERAGEGRFMLHAGGGCPVCEKPCRREEGPCRHPEEVRYSIESLGGDVCAVTEELLGYGICWIEDGKIPAYLSLVGGMLCR